MCIFWLLIGCLGCFSQVLTDEIGERARSAGVEAITVFTETLLLLTNEQMKLCKPAASPADPGGPAATAKAEGSAPSASPVPPSEEKMGPPPSHPVEPSFSYLCLCSKNARRKGVDCFTVGLQLVGQLLFLYLMIVSLLCKRPDWLSKILI